MVSTTSNIYEKELFSGKIVHGGGLSNGTGLWENCPDKFKTPNSWSKLASELFSGKGSFFFQELEWVSNDGVKRDHQKSCLYGILTTDRKILAPEQKNAIAGWMLSVMLKELPK